ncbi:MAG: hypothetical protein ACI9F2_001055 [Lysobacterales bacterium]|jgi:hypothetical protein
MKIDQKRWQTNSGWQSVIENNITDTAQLVLLFGSSDLIKNEDTFQEIKKLYPAAHILGCSTAGEICGTEVTDDTLVLTAIEFEHTTIQASSSIIDNMKNSFSVGQALVKTLPTKDLVHAFVLSDGVNVNGSELVKGITKQLPDNVTVTGGLSGDADKFEETYVVCNKQGQKNTVGIIGLYGSHLEVGYSSLGGWDPFGPQRVVTKSTNNILYELDGKSALELYKSYLGEHAKDLPASGLLFPLTIRTSDTDEWVVRTLLAVNEEDSSLVFAGDIPENSQARLMKANFERLIDGAHNAAKTIHEKTSTVDLAILISCVGRKMILKQRIEEEVEAVSDIFNKSAVLTGFYSYGEISPFTSNAKCELHNQTMTITTLTER